jgi:hypothetical protein
MSLQYELRYKVAFRALWLQPLRQGVRGNPQEFAGYHETLRVSV